MTDPKKFFDKENCDRCKQALKDQPRIMSWFTEECICIDPCAMDEALLKEAMRAQGIKPKDYEACGFIPDLEKIA